MRTALLLAATACAPATRDPPKPCGRPFTATATLNTDARRAELALSRIGRAALFPAVGGEGAPRVSGVRLTVKSAAPLRIELEAGPDDARELATTAAGGGVVLVTGPSPVGRLVLTRTLPGLAGRLEVRAEVGTPLGEACSATRPDTIQLAAVPGRCGDGLLDPGEACDDGNAVPADGCFGCALEPAQCGGDRRLWTTQCRGEPSVCSTTACVPGTDGCPATAELTVRVDVRGRTTPGGAAVARVTGADGAIDCTCEASGRCGPRCTATVPTCRPFELAAAVDPDEAVAWSGACEGTRCRATGLSHDDTAAARVGDFRATALRWRAKAQVDAHAVLVAGAGPWVATATEHAVAIATARGRGALVFARTTTVRIYDDTGRVRAQTGLGGLYGDVRPQSLALTPDGGSVLAASFPGDSVRIVRLAPGGETLWNYVVPGRGPATVAVDATGAVAAAVHERGGVALRRFAPRGRVVWTGPAPTGKTARPPRGLAFMGNDLVYTDGTIVAAIDPGGAVRWRRGYSEGVSVVADATGTWVAATQPARIAELGPDGAQRWARPLALEGRCEGRPLRLALGDAVYVAYPECMGATGAGFAVLAIERGGKPRWVERPALGGTLAGLAGPGPTVVTIEPDTVHVVALTP